MIAAPVLKPATPVQVAGAGSARQLAQGLGGARAVMVTDAGMSGRAEKLRNAGVLWMELVDSPVTVAAASTLARRLTEARVDRVLSVGGGNTMDLAKLSIAMAADPLVELVLERNGAGSGVVVLPRRLERHIDHYAVPTTFGTGSEMNPAACYESVCSTGAGTIFARAKNLVLLDGMATSAIAYDPKFLDSPPWLTAEGLLEPAVRLLTSLVEQESALDYADAQGRRLLAAAGDNLAAGRKSSFLLSGQARVDAALLSAESHAGWSLRGRGAAPSSLWFLANELSMALGIRKNQASALLLVPWLDAVLGGRTVWGHRRKLQELWPLLSANLAAAGTSALLGSGFDGPAGTTVHHSRIDLPSTLAEQLAVKTLRRFGRGRPMKRELGREDLAEMFAAAIRAAIGQEILGIEPYGR